MTNREAFNLLLRQDMEDKLKAVCEMDTGLLVAAPRDYMICVKVHDMLCVYKINSTGKKIGTMQDVVDWLNSERTDEEEQRWQRT